MKVWKHLCFLRVFRKHFTVWVKEHWHRMPREVVRSPSLELFKSYLDMVLSEQWG